MANDPDILSELRELASLDMALCEVDCALLACAADEIDRLRKLVAAHRAPWERQEGETPEQHYQRLLIVTGCK